MNLSRSDSLFLFSMSNFLTKTNTQFMLALRKTIDMSVPIVGARVSGALSGFLAMLIVAHLGHAQLAAGALINGVIAAILVPIWSLFFSVGVLVGYVYGSKQKDEVSKILQQSLLLSVAIGIPVMLLIWNIGPILSLCKQEPLLVNLAEQCFHPFSFCVIPSLIYGCLTQLSIGISRQKVASYCNIFYLVILVCSCYAFVFGKYGFKAMGMSGVGYANVLTYLVMDIGILVYYYRSKHYRDYKLFSWHKSKTFHYLRQLFNVGWPIGALLGAELGALTVSTLFVGWMGEAALAAQQITLQINMIAFMVPYGIATASTIVISQELGRKNYAVIRSISHAGNLLGVGFMVLLALIYYLFPKFFIGFYLDVKSIVNQQTVALSVSLLMITSLLNIADVIRTTATCCLRGLRDTLVPMWISVITSCVISLPLCYFLAFKINYGVLGVRWGFVIAFLIGAVVLSLRFHRLSSEENLVKLKYSTK